MYSPESCQLCVSAWPRSSKPQQSRLKIFPSGGFAGFPHLTQLTTNFTDGFVKKTLQRLLRMSFSHVAKVRILYKTILKLHRGLPVELKALGDQYAKEEFKRHKTCSDQEAQVFISSWADYAINLAQQLGLKGKTTGKFGVPLKETVLDNLRDEQVAQLYELLKAAQGLEEDKEKEGT